jgi:DNA invertase Pin-like site-specific DNA recombinase
LNFARLYLRASTEEQDATRARATLELFARERGLTVVATYTEHESGASLARPELWRLLSDSRPGDALVVEQVDRLSRLTETDWLRLRQQIDARQVRIVALDLPTSWALAASTDEFTSRMFGAVNAMLLDVLAAVARKDYADRRRRAAEGIAKRKAAGGYPGRPEDVRRNSAIASMLRRGMSWSEVMTATNCSRATVSKVAARVREEARADAR